MLSRLDHKNIISFMGIFEPPHDDDDDGYETPYIVSPWMEYGTITECMRILKQRKKDVPRIRWVGSDAPLLTLVKYTCTNSALDL